MLAAPLRIALALDIGRLDGEGGKERAVGVDDGKSDPHRAVARFARKPHKARNRLDDLVDGRIVAHRAGLPVSRNRAENQPAIVLFDLVIAQAQPVDHPGPEIFDQDVACGHQLAGGIAAEPGLEIEHHRFLARIGTDERLGHAAQLASLRIVAQHIAAGRLDLDDLGAEQPQEMRSKRAAMTWLKSAIRTPARGWAKVLLLHLVH